MNKNNLAAGLMPFVLSAGLISCSKEQKTTDQYRAPAPVILSEKNSFSLKDWEKQSRKTLDLQSKLEFSSPPARLEVVSNCRRDNQSHHESFSFQSPRSLQVFQLIPLQLLVQNMEAQKTDCAFELSFFNAIGSRHIFQISTVVITDAQPAGVLIDLPGEDQNLKRIGTKMIAGTKLRHRNKSTASVELTCEGLSFGPLPFEQVAMLDHFDFRRPHTNPQKAVPQCRALLWESGVLKQISRLFELQLPLPKLKTEFTPLPVTGSLKFPNRHVLGLITVHNPSSVVRQLRIAKSPLPVHIEIQVPPWGSSQSLGYEVATASVPWLIPAINNAQEAVISESAGAWLIKMEAGGTLTLKLEFIPKQLVCTHRGMRGIAGTFIHPNGPLVIEEVDEEHQAIERFSQTISAPVFDGHVPRSLFDKFARSTRFCNWN